MSKIGIGPLRLVEIEKGLNASTARPIYVVYEQVITVCEHDTAYNQGSSVFGDQPRYIRVSEDGHVIKAEKKIDKWADSIKKGGTVYGPVLMESYHDRFVTVCFTRAGAEDFIARERHNLKKPRIYVESAERRNSELNEIIKFIENEDADPV